VVSGASVTAEGENAAQKDLSYFGNFLLTFGIIALFVGAFAAQANFPSSLDIAIYLKLAPGVTTTCGPSA
jgi:hypothetical protein